jgi:hypothetical protein
MVRAWETRCTTIPTSGWLGFLHRIAPDVDLDQVDRTEPVQDASSRDSMDFLNLVAALYDETGIATPARDYPVVASIHGPWRT